MSDLDKVNPDVLCTEFNQDSTSVAIGTKTGLKIWSIRDGGNSIDLLHQDNSQPRITLAERLFSSSLLIVVSQENPRRLRVLHFRKSTEICAYSYSSAILSCRINRLRLIVILENAIYIHNIKDMKMLHNIKDTPNNSYGICCLSTS